jgi:putative chitinase
MGVIFDVTKLLELAPNARSSYKAAAEKGQDILDRYQITENSLRLCHFLAQVLHESGGLAIQFENLNYSAKRIPQVWPSRFLPKGPLNPLDYEHNPEKLANEVYGKRMGNTDPGDGYKYRGRGLIQLTGRGSYRKATEIVKRYNPSCPDFVEKPDEVISADWCIEVAAAEWYEKDCNIPADEDNITKVTLRINGGKIGLAERTEWLSRVKNKFM